MARPPMVVMTKAEYDELWAIVEAADRFIEAEEANPLDWNHGPTYECYLALVAAARVQRPV